VDLVCIDYLQLINEPFMKGENKDQQLGRITKQLKALANELKIVIVILSQMSRGVEKDNRSPVLSDLRESGNIEQDCDRVVFIHRPTTKPDGSEQRFEDDTIRFLYCELLQRKGRNVGEHSLGIHFERRAARFIPIARDTRAPGDQPQSA
jgi:replicative DNA helicase